MAKIIVSTITPLFHLFDKIEKFRLHRKKYRFSIRNQSDIYNFIKYSKSTKLITLKHINLTGVQLMPKIYDARN